MVVRCRTPTIKKTSQSGNSERMSRWTLIIYHPFIVREKEEKVK